MSCMGSQYKWQKDFGITDEQIREWKSYISERESVLIWAIKNHHIDEEKYLNWAQEQYGLLRIKEEFFDSKKPNQELMSRYSNLWPKHVALLMEWEGTLYLACLEPDSSIVPPQSYIWVLAPSEKILKWNECHSTENSVPSNAPPGIDLNVEVLVPDFELSDESATQIVSSEKLSPPVDHPDEIVPEGLNFESLDLPNDLSDKTKVGGVVKDDSPAGLNLENMKPPSLTSETIAPENLNLPPLPVDTIREIELSSDTSTPPEGILQVSSAIDEALPIKPTQTEDLSKVSKEAERKTSGQLDEYLFSELPSEFSQKMILLFNGENLEPWKWDETWVQDVSRQTAIDLSSPSVFRIVQKSCAPFHGPVVPNSINDTFFQTWNSGRTPEWLTILPLYIENSIVGMVLGTANKEDAEKLKIERLEHLANMASRKLLANPSAA